MATMAPKYIDLFMSILHFQMPSYIIPSLTVKRKQISARPCNHWLGGDSSFQKMLYGVFYFKISFSFLFSSFGW